MSIPWISDPTVADYRDAAEGEFESALAAVQATYPDARFTELIPDEPHYYVIEVEHEDYLLRFADAEHGHLHRSDRTATEWECIVVDEDGDDVMRETGADLGMLTRDVRLLMLARVDADRAAQADDPDRAHDSREY